MPEAQAKFTIDEIRQATGATLEHGSPEGEFQLATDSRGECANAVFIALKGEAFDAHDFLGKAVANHASALLVERAALPKVSPNWNIPVLAVENTLHAYWQLAHFHRMRFPKLKVAALTGSVGKTSVKEMTKSILIAAAGGDPTRVLATVGNTNNHFGVPQNLLQINEYHRFAVLEAGTSSPGEIEPLSRMIAPDAAAINTIAACHLEKLGSLEGVAKEKSAIFAHLRPGGTAVFPVFCAGQAIIEEAAEGHRKVRFGEDGEVRCRCLAGNIEGSEIELVWADGETRRVKWRLSGRHQAANAACAAALAEALGATRREVAEGLTHTELPGMRMNVKKFNGASWVLDAYNANPESMKSALEWLAEFTEGEKFVAVLGDMLELGAAEAAEHLALLERLAVTFPAARAVLVGERLAGAAKLPGARRGENWRFFASSAEAADAVAKLVRPGDTVLVKGSRGIRLEKTLPEGVGA